MFEGYSLRAWGVLLLARLRAGERGADALEIDDLLVALIIEDQRGFLRARFALGGHPDSAPETDPWPHRSFLAPGLASDVLARLEGLCTRSQPVPGASDMPASDGARRAFTVAAALRDELQQKEIEPLHLLAAIVGDGSSKGAQIVRGAGITREKIVEAIRESTAAAASDRPPIVGRAGPAIGPPVYSKRALAVHFLARLKARTRGARTIEVGDLLGALLIEDQGGFLQAVSGVPGVGIDVTHIPPPHRPFLPRDLANDLLTRVQALCSKTHPLPPESDLPVSEGVDRAFAVAGLLRDALQQKEIEPLHLLAAIVGAEPSSGAQMFRDAGVTPEKIFKATRGGSA